MKMFSTDLPKEEILKRKIKSKQECLEYICYMIAIAVITWLLKIVHLDPIELIVVLLLMYLYCTGVALYQFLKWDFYRHLLLKRADYENL